MVTIRPSQPSDLNKLQTLFERFVRSADWLPPGSDKESDFAKTSEGERVFVAVSESDQLIGAVSVWEPESFIHCLFVDPDYQGQGVGTQLLESLAPWLSFPWKLKCLATNHRAIQFYRRRGWKKLETGTSDHGTYFLLWREAAAVSTD
ncbi:GNAT family N-acetyltransferase [Bremerella alba]|uniref:N-acetyltransferase domain-containing protein n=1 Tax=Bremerella alba TaxID=980252 RepID=A0A7V9A7H1_9BACT|nr:GNAT family N-acetyltransferase [Bremerella alba]MBA2115400.1 hypothetical protein [Bremerella alba]